MNHQPLLHPDATFVGFSHCMLSNAITFRVITESKLGVEVPRDDRSVIFVTVVLDAFAHVLDVNCRVPCAGRSKHQQSFANIFLTKKHIRFHLLFSNIPTPCF